MTTGKSFSYLNANLIQLQKTFLTNFLRKNTFFHLKTIQDLFCNSEPYIIVIERNSKNAQ